MWCAETNRSEHPPLPQNSNGEEFPAIREFIREFEKRVRRSLVQASVK
jgi:hypothetical protein